MALILLAKHETYLPPASCSVSIVTDDATDQVLDVEAVNTMSIAFTAALIDQRDQVRITRTIPANSGTNRLPAGQRNALQSKGLTCVLTHGQAMVQTQSGREARITVELTPA